MKPVAQTVIDDLGWQRDLAGLRHDSRFIEMMSKPKEETGRIGIMTTHTFTGHIEGADHVFWWPRPKNQTAKKHKTPILVGDTIVFKARDFGDEVHLSFPVKTPFEPKAPSAPFEYHSPAGTGLALTVVGPPDTYLFNCGIRHADGQVIGLSNEGDQIPVGH